MEEEYEYDKKMVLAVIIILLIAVGGIVTLIRFWPEQQPIINNIRFSTNVICDKTEIDLKYTGFFGSIPMISNLTMYQITIYLDGMEFINKLAFTVSMSDEAHLHAVVLTELMNEANTLHGKSDISTEQNNYAATINAYAIDYVLYLFCDIGDGNLEFSIRAYGG